MYFFLQELIEGRSRRVSRHDLGVTHKKKCRRKMSSNSIGYSSVRERGVFKNHRALISCQNILKRQRKEQDKPYEAFGKSLQR